MIYFFVSNFLKKESVWVQELLEPEAPNSFVSFGILRTKINEILPIYRLIN